MAQVTHAQYNVHVERCDLCELGGWKMAATATATKEAKPTLGGTKFKTRKRDEKVKLDVTSFSEQLISGLRESGGNLDEVRRYLDTAGSQLDYR